MFIFNEAGDSRAYNFTKNEHCERVFFQRTWPQFPGDCFKKQIYRASFSKSLKS